MKAYAILDGGGVKGAALAGCLKAASERGIDFAGYGGTSAGSIVALLACVGYTGQDLERIMTQEINFGEFLGSDQGNRLERLKSSSEHLQSIWRTLRVAVRERESLTRIRTQLGLYRGRELEDFLKRMIKDKIRALENNLDITFQDLENHRCPPLKIVVSDLRDRKPKVYAARGGDFTGSVIDAVRASISYPFVFEPVPTGSRYMVDGGLTSNLPVWLFEDERRRSGLPVLAFDLQPSKEPLSEHYNFQQFCGDMLATALESTDHLVQKLLSGSGVYYIPIGVPDGIGTLDFSLSVARRRELFTKGEADTNSYINTNLQQWSQARDQVERLQAIHAPSGLVKPLLGAFAKEFETNTPAQNVRAHIMLPTGRDKRIVVYHYGMDMDPDADLELEMDGGCSGRAWSTRRPTPADLVAARTDYASNWKMTESQQSKVRRDRKAMFSVPMFHLPLEPQPVEHLDLFGILSVDTDTSLEDTLWTTHKKEYVERTGKLWADIFSKFLN